MMTNATDAEIRHVYDQWHEAVVRRDISGLVALYAQDAIFENPAVLALNGGADGVLHGRNAISSYFETFFRKLDKNVAEWFRTDALFSNGKQLIWEYPRATPHGDQTDRIESMDIENGLIKHHRVYWGWVGFNALLVTLKSSD